MPVCIFSHWRIEEVAQVHCLVCLEDRGRKKFLLSKLLLNNESVPINYVVL